MWRTFSATSKIGTQGSQWRQQCLNLWFERVSSVIQQHPCRFLIPWGKPRRETLLCHMVFDPFPCPTHTPPPSKQPLVFSSTVEHASSSFLSLNGVIQVAGLQGCSPALMKKPAPRPCKQHSSADLWGIISTIPSRPIDLSLMTLNSCLFAQL